MKPLAKAAKKALYRLRSKGIAVPEAAPPPAPEPPRAPEPEEWPGLSIWTERALRVVRPISYFDARGSAPATIELRATMPVSRCRAA